MTEETKDSTAQTKSSSTRRRSNQRRRTSKKPSAAAVNGADAMVQSAAPPKAPSTLGDATVKQHNSKNNNRPDNNHKGANPKNKVAQKPNHKENNNGSESAKRAPKAAAKTTTQPAGKSLPKQNSRQTKPPYGKSPKPQAAKQPTVSVCEQPVTATEAQVGGKESKLKVIPLGGMGEIGKNMTVIQYEDDIVVIDGGVMFPEEELLGVDLVIPDITYLKENREKVKGVLLTHGHEDHIGGIPYLLKVLDVPVYGSRLTLGLLEIKLREHHIKGDLHEVTGRQKVKLGHFTIEFIRVSHSIPDTLSMAVHTPLGTLLFICDFKLDMSPVDGKLIDLDTLSKLWAKGVLLMMSDSTNVEKKGFTPSEQTVGESFDRIFPKATGRIIVTSFASNVHRIQQAVWAAEQCHRKVAFVGRGIQNVSSIAIELGYLKIPDGMLIDIDQINKYRDDEIIIITTGSQGEPLSGLTRMSQGEHRQVRIGAGDLVVISASPIPGNERLVARTVDNLYRLGATVIYGKEENIHVSGHASQDELSVMLNLIRPRFFLPAHGEYRMLYKHALLAQKLGMPAENTFVMENGQVLEVGRRHCRIRGAVPSGRVFVDGLGVGDVGNTILKERKLLSEGGIVTVNMVLDRLSGVMLYGPEISSRGFVFEKEYDHILKEAGDKVTSIYAAERADKDKHPGQKLDVAAMRAQVASALSRCFFNKTGRRPIIIPIITEV